VKNSPYFFEIKDIMTQFIAAFNDVTINRYNKDRDVKDKIHARYVYAPKQRVLHDIVNKNQHITLPAIAVSINGISRDSDRVFNKIFGTYMHTGLDDDSINTNSDFMPAPIPIDISVNMSILARYQTDMDQILSNFIPYNNPYVIISWKVPSDFVTDVQEIRTEVLWSGNISLTYPTDLDPNTPARLSGDTSFTIKSWLFPHKNKGDGKNILYVNTDFQTLSTPGLSGFYS
tara:strand:- start:612 stop:1304 length:693 start_codon:yes stop_codon:yes gene_type:complete